MKQHNCPHLKILAMQEQMQACILEAQTKISQSDAAARQAEAEKLALADAAQQREQALQAQMSADAAAAQQRAAEAEARAAEVETTAERHFCTPSSCDRPKGSRHIDIAARCQRIDFFF